MSKLRISIVEYLNTAPLVWGFTNGPLAGRYELSFTVPSLCAEALRTGAVDVAIIPAIEYQRMDGLVVLPEMSIAAKRDVRSLLLLSKKPIEQAQRIALDSSSRSTQALVRILCAGRWKISPEFVQAAPDPSVMLTSANAALVIGDPALRIAARLDELAGKSASGEFCCGGDPESQPVRGVDTLFVYDVAYEWQQMTGLPCVLAVWAARKEAITPEVVADFTASKEYGMSRIAEIADAASLKLNLPATVLETYLRDNIDFSLDEPNRRGLELYYRRCAELGLIPRAKPLELAAMPARSTASSSA